MNSATRNELAIRIANDIPAGSYVNLGVGIPTLVANHLTEEKEVILHTENGVLGRWIDAPEGEEDGNLINAGKVPIKLFPGAAFFHHADSFAIMRGGHLDICVLGAFQVSAQGDLANWHTGDPEMMPAVGGAMDLAVGAKKTFVVMDLLDKRGQSKLVPSLTYPPTGLKCVNRIYTNYGTFEIRDNDVPLVTYVAEGITKDELEKIAGVDLKFVDSY
ncbi:CoA-transferase [Marinobacter sp.]|uniref:CoA-transferase n=1 Tax=Marinobacter sp. TaxID=50741 RepID=UPI003A8EC9B6